ncbi:hypothetical protein NG796_08515 [Laspinema sp. A4]|nr:hypothetical protein [Laspinema sp. D2d]
MGFRCQSVETRIAVAHAIAICLQLKGLAAAILNRWVIDCRGNQFNPGSLLAHHAEPMTARFEVRFPTYPIYPECLE